MKKVEAIKCDFCGTLHEVDNDDQSYHEFCGTFDGEDVEAIICDTADCLKRFIERYTGKLLLSETKLPFDPFKPTNPSPPPLPIDPIRKPQPDSPYDYPTIWCDDSSEQIRVTLN